MLNGQGMILSKLTGYELGRVNEMSFISSLLRNIAGLAGEGTVDPDELRDWANVFDINKKDIVNRAKKSMQKGPAQIVGGVVCLHARRRQTGVLMRPDVAEDQCCALECAAVDVVRVINTLYGLQAVEYAEPLAMLADKLLQAARGLREMSEGMEEDGDE